MIPSSVAAVVSFLLLLAPGIVWELQRARYVPAVKESALIEVSRVILASLLATGVSAGLLLAFVWLPLYRAARASSSDPLTSPVSAVPYVGAVLATSLLACGLTWIVAACKWPGKAPIRGVRVWHRAFVEWKPSDGPPPKLAVELLDGTVWHGTLQAFDSDPEDDQRGIALGSPLLRKRPNGPLQERPEGWQVVVLPESQIKSIQVGYLPAQ
ncbi:DUF6338 family protein [Georgenia soli]|uniref:DUF6338 family protein n=1 Tax=Georgenia soli TaxID=638953 RepID=UPI003CCBFB20